MCDPMNQKTKNVLPKYNLNTYVEQTLPFKNGERERKMSQVLNPKPMRRNLLRFQLREHFSMGGKKKNHGGQPQLFNPPEK